MDGHQHKMAGSSRVETPHINPRPLDEPAAKPRLETRCELVRLLKTGTSLSPTAARRTIQVARESVEGSLNAISRLDEEVRELFEYCTDEVPIEQMESVVQTFEDEILEWEQTRTIRPRTRPLRPNRIRVGSQ
jgi:hypothetical protein